MNLDDFGRVADAALGNIESLLGDWFPNGVREGNEFCIGSRFGEAGRSMKVRLSGDRAGFWSDFSSDGDAGRDLISLYSYIHSVSQGQACLAVAQQVGVALTDTRQFASGKPVQPSTPPKSVAPQKLAPAPAIHGVEDVKPRTEWEPVLPVPKDAGLPPSAHVVRGKPDKTWKYRNEQGQLLGVIYRFTTSDGGKVVLPCVFARHAVTGKTKWHWISFRDPRPLYLRGPYRHDLPVLVVEGERCVDAVFALVGEAYDVVSWPGGGKAVTKADWSALAGRTVWLWADADAKVYKDGHAEAGQIMPEDKQPGMSTMLKLAPVLRGLGCVVHLVDIDAPGVKPDGWDVFDMIAEGATEEAVLAFIARTRAEPVDVQDAPAAQQDDAPPTEMPPWVAADAESISTPAGACAGGMTRKQVRAMMFAGGSPGSVKGCRENAYFGLKYDPVLTGLVALDEFALLQVKLRDPPWESEPGEWTEGDDFRLSLYLGEHYGLLIASLGDIEKAVGQVARENGFNPVTDMLDACALAWDGVDRVKDAFTKYWGAPASEYMQTVSRMFFVGLAKRAYVPGVKHDDAPVFEGRQGEGKSTALSILGGDWFADTPFRMGEKDGYLSIQGILIYEIAELEQFNRSEVTAVKAFMSSQKDRYREPYGRRMKNQSRRTVFAATTNEGQYFKDATGNRRFWPVDTGTIDLEGLRRDRDQILGEAVHLMRTGAKWYPCGDEQSRLITPMQESREMWDEWSGRIWEYLEGLGADGEMLSADKKLRVTARELITRALHIEIGKVSQAKTETGRISNIMRKFGWKKERDTTGAREWFYSRPVAAPVLGNQAGGDDDLPI